MSNESIFGQVFGEPLPVTVPPPPAITAWSYSRLSTYEGCPRRAKYQFVDKIAEKENDAIVRGKNVHAVAASLLSGQEPPLSVLPDDINVLRPWEKQLKALIAMNARPELQVAFNVDWQLCDWFSRAAWLRIVFDALVEPTPDRRQVLVIDFKTGKPSERHTDQLTLYGCGAQAMFPGQEAYEVCFVYLDHPGRPPLMRKFTEAEAVAARAAWEERSGWMLRDSTFPTKVGPGCRWCPYAKSKGGPCEQG